MAITHIHPIKQPLIKSIRYARNPDKTDGGFWIQAYNCPQEPFAAYRTMQESKAHHKKAEGVQGHMILFSFSQGEVSKEKAFEILNTFAERYLAEKFETVVAMHTNQDHLHGHIVFNSVSYKDGQKYHSNAQEYYGQIRRIADEICRENGLQVIVPGGGKTGKHYIEWQLEKRGFATWKQMARSDIDMALRHSIRFSDFLIKLENMGHSVNNDPNRKHVTISPPRYDKPHPLKHVRPVLFRGSHQSPHCRPPQPIPTHAQNKKAYSAHTNPVQPGFFAWL